MSSTQATDRPNVGAVLAPLLQSIPRHEQPLFIALAERFAAGRYREWAAAAGDLHRADLLACADREEDIAARIEALHPNAASIQRELIASHPHLEEINRKLFAGRPLAEQFAIQAEGERLGAATWRSFARHGDEAWRETYLACAALEEASAVVLERILAEHRP